MYKNRNSTSEARWLLRTEVYNPSMNTALNEMNCTIKAASSNSWLTWECEKFVFRCFCLAFRYRLRIAELLTSAIYHLVFVDQYW